MPYVWSGAGQWRPKPPTATVQRDEPRPVACCPRHSLDAERNARAIEAAREVLDAKQTSPGARRAAERILGVLTGGDTAPANAPIIPGHAS